MESDIVQQLMMKDFQADWTLHLGDVYYKVLQKKLNLIC